jgi:histidinol-phosphatase (PHP family)
VTLRTSYHTHNRYCDGKGEIADYAAAAAAAGLEALGVTSHSPLPFPDPYTMRPEDLPAYLEDVRRVRAAYAGRLRVHLGLEFDYLPEYAEAMWAMLDAHPFDYLIGSVHFVGADPRGVPAAYELSRRGFERGLGELFGGDIRHMIAEYYRRVRALVAWRRTAILGHLDRIKMWNSDNRYFDEQAPWYRDEVEATLLACAGAGTIVEINTAGWRQAVHAPYPSPWIVRRCLDLAIPLIVTTDAHQPERVTEFHEQAEALLREAGCTRLAVLRDGGWAQEPI